MLDKDDMSSCVSLFSLAAAVAVIGCADGGRLVAVPPHGGVVYVPPPGSPAESELKRCEATGLSREQCCENHNIDPCP
jgi:hypothetical protein